VPFFASFLSAIAKHLPASNESWPLGLRCDRETGTFERLQAGDADVVQEPTEQPYGVRDCAFRDPAGNLLRIQERG
jgi:uncharacterized glyoxalase superfamily protein PhnB